MEINYISKFILEAEISIVFLESAPLGELGITIIVTINFPYGKNCSEGNCSLLNTFDWRQSSSPDFIPQSIF